MAETLKVQRGTPADRKGVSHKPLERNDGFLPVEFAEWALICSPHGLNQPSGGYVLAAQARRIAMPLHPSRIGQQALWEGPFELV